MLVGMIVRGDVVCVALGHVSGSGEGLGWVVLGMCVWGVLWEGVQSCGVVVVVVVGCGSLVRLGSHVTIWVTAGCCVSKGILFLGGSLSSIMIYVGYERLRLWVCAV